MDESLSLHQLVDSAPDGFLVVSQSGEIVWANETAGSLFGIARHELVGKGVEELMPERFRNHHLSLRTDYQQTPQSRPMGLGLELWALKADGSEIPVEISLSPVEVNGTSLVTAVVRDISERRQLEQERSQLATDLETERERDRIAMDLHDGIMQDIYAAALSLEVALEDGTGAESVDPRTVERAIDGLHAVIRNIRSYIFDLRPREFGGNLADALQDMAREFQQNSQIKAEAKLEGNGKLELTTAVALYNITHEALSNVQKHANAGCVTVRLRLDAQAGYLEVEDDGTGFDTSAQLPEEHRGLRNMYKRASSIKGTLTIDSEPGTGTRFRVDFPLNGELSQ